MSAPDDPALVTMRTDRLLTVPNGLTVIRLCCIPVFLWLLFGREDRAMAAWLLGALGATDWVDGYIARRFGQVSELGKVLDPTADRLLLIVGIGSIIIDGSAPIWFAVLVLVREVVFGGALVILTLVGMKRFDVRWVGKAGTFANMFAFPLFLMGEARVRLSTLCHWLGWLCAIPGLALSYWAAITYVPTIRRSLAEGRADRAVGRSPA